MLQLVSWDKTKVVIFENSRHITAFSGLGSRKGSFDRLNIKQRESRNKSRNQLHRSQMTARAYSWATTLNLKRKEK